MINHTRNYLFLLFFISSIFANFGKNIVQYDEFNWSFIQTKHFNIYYYNLNKDQAELAAYNSEKAYKKIEKLLGEHGRNKDKLLNKIDLDDLTVAVRYKEKFEDSHSIKFSIEEIVLKGLEKIELDLTKEDFPALSKVIDDYVAFRATPEGNSKGDWIIDSNTRTSEKTFLTVINPFVLLSFPLK